MDWLSTLIDSFLNSDIGRLLVNILRKVGENPKFADFCLALGAMIGTMIALVFTLSIIPIQRAVELLSPSVAAHYRRYWPLILIYVFLGISCVVSYLMAFSGGGLIGGHHTYFFGSALGHAFATIKTPLKIKCGVPGIPV